MNCKFQCNKSISLFQLWQFNWKKCCLIVGFFHLITTSKSFSISYANSQHFQQQSLFETKAYFPIPKSNEIISHRTNACQSNTKLQLNSQSAIDESNSNNDKTFVLDEIQSVLSTDKDNSDLFFIREADFADLGTVARILTDGFFADKTNFITYQLERIKTQLSLESTFPKKQSYKSNSKTDLHFMLITGLKSNGRVVGFAELDSRLPILNLNQSSTSPTQTQPRPYMCNLAVDNKWKRRGIATSLIQCCEDICVNYWHQPNMYLKVRRGNKAANDLYKGLGYEEDSMTSDVDNSSTKQNNDSEEIILMKKSFLSSRNYI